ncbi:MAG: hypothetical protein R3362_09615 [Rhodothermales bacterium]|nr:hypothetical protein [Rhodothermales bacterium]
MESTFGKRSQSPASYSLRSVLPEPRLKLLLVDFHRGESVESHPELRALRQEGWEVKSIAPRFVEGEGLKLLVVLQRARRTRPPRQVA